MAKRLLRLSQTTIKPTTYQQQPIEGLTHGQSVQHVILNKFHINRPEQQSPSDHEQLVYPLSSFVFGQPFRSDIIHRCVNFERSLMRSGSANTKTRSEVAMSGRKLRPQKGSGRARLGDASSPTLRKGGAAFGPKPKDWAQGIQRKVWELGLRTILSQRWREGRLIVVDKFEMDGQEEASEQLARLMNQRAWSSAVMIAGGHWGTEANGWKDPGLLRQALARTHLVKDGIRLGQSGPEWARIQRTKILPILNNIDLAHPNDLRPGKPHPADLKPGRIGIYHLLLRKFTILDLNAVRHLEHHLTRDLRQPITALGLSPAEAHYQSVLANQSLSQQILDASH
ncbi:54S ribosomal protein, mitochondrial [Puccinia graminis f. sp. tritici]|uniref:Large ribosomal subunit protein uL4m n=3 Tax=Puccinia graminis f. sp. tritici TaxID=56615 RepID=E3JUX4_PUCGT|nr:uncharacterized protein PGTG_01180 [Puccinia graminis f. sp. tritici CRL 75-36-700-3]EFP75849.1 hypothetical protein PGTG_01180 [Puccinia graminis f. sp. tritici CRL 75-36-700-3]KAA1077471.1 54S ribosomal protein, mitochondrial [Puccinia graminis f. sp. tritici]KAA1102916.1 54S ribosomal protein, mitochondrial [Puccinia graminis f. sp. tritici]